MTTTLVLGGTRSGKAQYARRFLPADGAVTVMNAGGEAARSGRAAQIHGPREQVRVSDSWNVTDSLDVTRAILRTRNPVLIDCLGTWVVGLLDEWQTWDDPQQSLERIEQAAHELAALWSDAPYDAVAVSHEVGLSPLSPDPQARVYQECLGRVNTIISQASRRTHVVIAGRVLDLSDAPAIH